MDNEETYIPASKVKNILGLSTQSLANWRSLRKNLNYYKFQGAVRYKKSEILAYAESKKINIVEPEERE